MIRPQRLDTAYAVRECPECGYQNGFHLGFQRVDPNGGHRKLAVTPICPSCSAVYEVGWVVELPGDADPG